ncbi:MAG: pectin acetylesterase-family hydrolase [Woeseiaceae bacterium]|nr:pectin acetylesterase-family hydrolase [Woeseiaceae bacterium]
MHDSRQEQTEEEGVMRILTSLLLGVAVLLASESAFSDWGKRFTIGLNDEARAELRDAGVDKYMGLFTPVASEDIGDGWTRHSFDREGGDGPICIAGTPYSVFTRIRNPNKVMIFMQGGGACWEDFYRCNVLAEAQAPGSSPVSGIFVDKFDTGNRKIRNPLANWSIVYLPYCDGSVFSGDNDVWDPEFGEAIQNPQVKVRFHRGLRNATAGIDLAKDMFPRARRVLLAGSSAGGVGAASFAPFLARFAFGDWTYLSVFNDAGPIAINNDPNNPAAQDSILKRAADWHFDKFYPRSCLDCVAEGQGTAIIDWRLDNDNTITRGVLFDGCR